MKVFLRLIYLLGGLFFASTLFAADVEVDTLVFDWKIRSITDGKGTQLHNPVPADRFQIMEGGSFSMGILADSLIETGTWEHKGDSVYLSYELIPVSGKIDSLFYQVEEGEPVLLLYSEGKPMARQTLKGLDSKRRTEGFVLSWDERGNPTLSGAQRTIKLYSGNNLQPGSFTLLTGLRGLLGLAAMIGIAFLFSRNRKAVDWRLVGTGLGLQIIFAVLVLKAPFVSDAFEVISNGFVGILDFTKAGSGFLFEGLVKDTSSFGYIFAFQVLPIIVFFSALVSILYYLGILQRIVYGFAWLMSRTMRLSGAESLAAAGNIFLGQTEAPLLIRPYLDKMTRSEMMTLMTGGMATIAGSVFAAYVGYLGGEDPIMKAEFAKHLLTASIMSAPAALIVGKILVPETGEVNPDLNVPRSRIGSNLLDAISNGTVDGLKLAVNVGVMLLVFTALMAMLNGFFEGLIGDWTGLNDFVVESTDGRFSGFNLQYIFGLVFAPIAWLLGVPGDDIMVIGQLLGEKTIINEFIAYGSLGEVKETGQLLHEKSVIIATYALCGFANFASIGIQIGGIGSLAPNQRKTLTELGILSLLGGTLAAFLTAVIAGVLVFI